MLAKSDQFVADAGGSDAAGIAPLLLVAL